MHQQAIEIINLREENKSLKERIAELEGKQRQSVPMFKEPVDTTPKKTGQKKGHKGYSRPIPERIDEVKEHRLNSCPNCGEPVSKTQEIRERVIEDIEQPKAKTTKHIIHRCYCKKCKKIVEPVIKDALPNATFGLRLMIFVLTLKLDARIPSNKITSVLNSMFGIIISDGEIYGILNQLKVAFGDYYNELERKIKEALIKYKDETSWRTNGKNHWLWIFINKEVALYVIERKRNSRVSEDVLGNQKGKIEVTDRFEAHHKFSKDNGSLQQICWSHLLRNSKDLAGYYPEARYVHKRMKCIYKRAKEGKIKKEKLLHWIDLIGSRTYRSTEVYKFVKAICRKHREDLFRFVDNPEVESTNNRAERGLRHAVVMRKISGGSRSDKGAETTANLLSVLQTAKLQSNNHFNFMMDLLQMPK